MTDSIGKVSENSNMCYSLQGLNNYISSDVTAEYWLNRIYPAEIRDAHKGGDIHIHDLSLLSVYCVGWDLQDLLRQGFTGFRGRWRLLRRSISGPPSGRSSIFSTLSRGRRPAPRPCRASIHCWRPLSAMTGLSIRK